MAHMFGKYLLQQRLAMGGMAELFLAQVVGAAGFLRDVVIKRIHPELSDDPSFVQMFIHEAQLAAKLHHPNVVQVLDFDKVEDTYYIAMELVDGLDLKRMQMQTKKAGAELPVPLCVFVAMEALKGLSYAHNLRYKGEILHVVHRDISPQNILISEQGQVKIADFGIARVMQNASMTAQGVLKGKLGYMAPEQTLSSKVDPRADLFSIGVVLWELLCGCRLFHCHSQAELIAQVRTHPIPSPDTIRADIDPELSRVVMWALERPLEQRIPNAETMWTKLQPWAQSPALASELGKWVQRHRLSGSSNDPSAEARSASKAGVNSTAKLDGWAPPGSSDTVEVKTFSPTQTTGKGSAPNPDCPNDFDSTVQINPAQLLLSMQQHWKEGQNKEKLSPPSAEQMEQKNKH